MLLRLDPEHRAPLVSVFVTGFATPWEAASWRRAARRELAAAPSLVLARAMPFIAAGAGFSVGAPGPRRQVLIAAWRDEAALDAFLARPVAGPIARGPRTWWALFEVASARGTHLGVAPLAPTGTKNGAFAALTLGRARPRTLVRFLREGARLGAFTAGAPGLVSACSAGFPLTGNCTLSIWRGEREMVDYAYREPAGHARTAADRPPILREQLNARMRVRRLEGRFDGGALHPDRLARLARSDLGHD